jgi:hypothetical protein
MKIVMKMCTMALVGAALTLPHASEAAGKPPRGAQNKPISQPRNIREPSRTDKTRTTRKQVIASAKAAHKRGKATLKTARRDLAAVTRSEARNRQLRLDAKSRWDAAKQAHRANPSPATLNAWNAAYQAYMPIRQQHESSLATLRSQRNRVAQLEGFQTQALNAVSTAQGAPPPTPRTGQPRFAANRPANFVSPVSAYDRVPAPQQIYGGGQTQRVDNAAMSPQGAAQFVANAQRVLLDNFNQQVAQGQSLAPGQVRAGPQNNVYQRAPAVQNAYQQATDALFY